VAGHGVRIEEFDGSHAGPIAAMCRARGGSPGTSPMPLPVRSSRRRRRRRGGGRRNQYDRAHDLKGGASTCEPPMIEPSCNSVKRLGQVTCSCVPRVGVLGAFCGFVGKMHLGPIWKGSSNDFLDERPEDAVRQFGLDLARAVPRAHQGAVCDPHVFRVLAPVPPADRRCLGIRSANSSRASWSPARRAPRSAARIGSGPEPVR
jgi:hypothetical protein